MKMVKVYVVEDDAVYAKLIEGVLEQLDNVEVVVFDRGSSFVGELHNNPDIVILDYQLPDANGIDLLKKVGHYNKEIPCVFLSGQEEVEVVVEAYKNGVKNYIVKNEHTMVELQNSVKNLLGNISLQRELGVLKEKIIDRSRYDMLIGESPAIMKVLQLIQKVENTNMLVLITGESGTGKEVVANAIHYNSKRKKKPFVAVNVAAIPEDLIESELFGHEKGAFTGAVGKRIGKFEEANGGTLFLDEIGEMNVTLQTKLLRVLQESKVTRLGSNKEIQLDVRVLAATNKNLSLFVKEGKFREDLYYRLQGFLIHVPPLRARGNDIMLIANHFLEEFKAKNKISDKSFSRDTKNKLMEHSFPGNVREIKSLVERAVLMSEGEVIVPEDLVFADQVWAT